MITKKRLKRAIAAAAKKTPADLVIKNGQIVDVFNGEIITGSDIAITDGVIVGIGTFEGQTTIDAQNRYVCPGLIDGHVHIESAMVTPGEFAKVALPHGVTTIIADPHEIANVGGIAAVEYMLRASDGLPLNIFIALPSCVPAAPFEQNGAVLSAEQLEPLYAHERVIGLGEVMDFPAVKTGDDDMLNKLVSAARHRKLIDGHAAGLDRDDINVYTAAGIRTDHECDTAEGARDRLRRGMYLMIREGSVSKDLKTLIAVVNERNARRCVFVTDDKDLQDLRLEGSIDHNIRMAIQFGIDPLVAIQMGTLNTAECFGLKGKGAIAPGYDADLILLDNLETFRITEVYARGKLVAAGGNCLPWDTPDVAPPEHLLNSIQMKEITAGNLNIRLEGTNVANVVGVVPNSLFTEHLIEKVKVKNGAFQPSVRNDQLKLVVVERHKRTGNIGLGIVKGFGLKRGAIASTVAHDSHNVIAVGTNDDDLLTAIRAIQEIRGGFAIVDGGRVLASLPLPIAGLMSDQTYKSVIAAFDKCQGALNQIGCSPEMNPFVTLSFLALPVIPSLKMTASGLFDVHALQHIPVGVGS